MKNTRQLVLGLCVTALLLNSTLQADVFLYPTQGQSMEQQDRDKVECHGWAVEETGFDPAAPAEPTIPPPEAEEPVGPSVKGTVKGAARGTVLGTIIRGNPASGAVMGAASSLLIGGIRSRRQKKREEKAQAQWEAQQATIYEQNRADYDRAMGACLEGRGYTTR